MNDLLLIIKEQLKMGYTLSFVEAKLLKQAIDVATAQSAPPVLRDCNQQMPKAQTKHKPVAWVEQSRLNWLSSHEFIQADLFSQQQRLDDVPLFTYLTSDGLPEMLTELALWINTLPVPTDSATKWLIRVSNMRDEVLSRKGIAAPEA